MVVLGNPDFGIGIDFVCECCELRVFILVYKTADLMDGFFIHCLPAFYTDRMHWVML